MRTLLIAVSILALLATGAFAQQLADCGTLSTVGEFAAETNGCVSDDKIFTYISQQGEVPSDFGIKIGPRVFGDDTFYSIQVVRPDVGAVAEATYAFAYTVAVAPGYDKWFINSVQLTGEFNPDIFYRSITKTAIDLNTAAVVADLTWDGSSVLADGFLSKGLLISQVINVNDAFSSTTDTYTQAVIPEPSTLALMGGGLVLVGLLRRRFTR